MNDRTFAKTRAWPLVVALPLALAACGGGGGGGVTNVVSTPTPPPPPWSPPTSALVYPVQTSSIASPVANGTAPNFSALGQATDFPLLQTQVLANGEGAAAFTQSGAILRAPTSGAYQLTVNDPSAGITNAGAGGAIGTYSFDASVDGQGNLDYTRYGYWNRFQVTEGDFNGGVFTGGFLTPAAAIPTTGTATYSGRATGLYNSSAACACLASYGVFGGNVAMTADFAALSIAGAITGITVTAPGLTAGAMNDLGFNATLDRPNNLFTGTIFPTTFPTGSWAFGSTATGPIVGRFYGPGGQEAGAVFTLSESSGRRLIGSFGVKRP